LATFRSCGSEPEPSSTESLSQRAERGREVPGNGERNNRRETCFGFVGLGYALSEWGYEVEVTKAVRVGDQLDRGDFLAADGELEDDARLPAGHPRDSGCSVY
jgi:hypothetical protein